MSTPIQFRSTGMVESYKVTLTNKDGTKTVTNRYPVGEFKTASTPRHNTIVHTATEHTLASSRGAENSRRKSSSSKQTSSPRGSGYRHKTSAREDEKNNDVPQITTTFLDETYRDLKGRFNRLKSPISNCSAAESFCEHVEGCTRIGSCNCPRGTEKITSTKIGGTACDYVQETIIERTMMTDNGVQTITKHIIKRCDQSGHIEFDVKESKHITEQSKRVTDTTYDAPRTNKPHRAEYEMPAASSRNFEDNLQSQYNESVPAHTKRRDSRKRTTAEKLQNRPSAEMTQSRAKASKKRDSTHVDNRKNSDSSKTCRSNFCGANHSPLECCPCICQHCARLIAQRLSLPLERLDQETLNSLVLRRPQDGKPTLDYFRVGQILKDSEDDRIRPPTGSASLEQPFQALPSSKRDQKQTSTPSTVRPKELTPNLGSKGRSGSQLETASTSKRIFKSTPSAAPSEQIERISYYDDDGFEDLQTQQKSAPTKAPGAKEGELNARSSVEDRYSLTSTHSRKSAYSEEGLRSVVQRASNEPPKTQLLPKIQEENSHESKHSDGYNELAEQNYPVEDFQMMSSDSNGHTQYSQRPEPEERQSQPRSSRRGEQRPLPDKGSAQLDSPLSHSDIQNYVSKEDNLAQSRYEESQRQSRKSITKESPGSSYRISTPTRYPSSHQTRYSNKSLHADDGKIKESGSRNSSELQASVRTDVERYSDDRNSDDKSYSAEETNLQDMPSKEPQRANEFSTSQIAIEMNDNGYQSEPDTVPLKLSDHVVSPGPTDENLRPQIDNVSNDIKPQNEGIAHVSAAPSRDIPLEKSGNFDDSSGPPISQRTPQTGAEQAIVTRGSKAAPCVCRCCDSPNDGTKITRRRISQTLPCGNKLIAEIIIPIPMHENEDQVQDQQAPTKEDELNNDVVFTTSVRSIPCSEKGNDVLVVSSHVQVRRRSIAFRNAEETPQLHADNKEHGSAISHSRKLPMTESQQDDNTVTDILQATKADSLQTKLEPQHSETLEVSRSPDISITTIQDGLEEYETVEDSNPDNKQREIVQEPIEENSRAGSEPQSYPVEEDLRPLDEILTEPMAEGTSYDDKKPDDEPREIEQEPSAGEDIKPLDEIWDKPMAEGVSPETASQSYDPTEDAKPDDEQRGTEREPNVEDLRTESEPQSYPIEEDLKPLDESGLEPVTESVSPETAPQSYDPTEDTIPYDEQREIEQRPSLEDLRTESEPQSYPIEEDLKPLEEPRAESVSIETAPLEESTTVEPEKQSYDAISNSKSQGERDVESSRQEYASTIDKNTGFRYPSYSQQSSRRGSILKRTSNATKYSSTPDKGSVIEDARASDEEKVNQSRRPTDTVVDTEDLEEEERDRDRDHSDSESEDYSSDSKTEAKILTYQKDTESEDNISDSDREMLTAEAVSDKRIESEKSTESESDVSSSSSEEESKAKTKALEERKPAAAEVTKAKPTEARSSQTPRSSISSKHRSSVLSSSRPSRVQSNRIPVIVCYEPRACYPRPCADIVVCDIDPCCGPINLRYFPCRPPPPEHVCPPPPCKPDFCPPSFKESSGRSSKTSNSKKKRSSSKKSK